MSPTNSPQVVETSVTVNNNSPIQDYVHRDDQTQPTFEMTPGFKPFTTEIMSYCYYTCQLFLRYKREIFILGVLEFLKRPRSFPKIPEEVRSLPKTSKVCRRRSYRENAYPQNQRSRGRYCHLFILHMVFVPNMGLS